MPTGVGGSSGSGHFELKPRWLSRKRQGLRFILTVGCVFAILGSSLTVVISTQVVERALSRDSIANPKWRAEWKGHMYAKGYQNTHFGSS